uniref:Uncharacterized protein n=1 Tax=Glossina pallidipes TaxID=7398 RepID=A0A1A9ZG50_GLOPL
MKKLKQFNEDCMNNARKYLYVEVPDVIAVAISKLPTMIKQWLKNQAEFTIAIGDECSAVKQTATACDVSKSTVAHVTTAFNCLKDNRWSCYASQPASQPASVSTVLNCENVDEGFTNSEPRSKSHSSSRGET